jgi:hypothetical protein
MIISLCAYLFDYTAPHQLEPDMQNSDFTVTSRRVSRTATLDGGALIVDNGYTASDATFTISVPNLSASDRLSLLATIQTHSLLVLSTPVGCFLGVVEKVDEANVFKIRFLVSRDLTQG